MGVHITKKEYDDFVKLFAAITKETEIEIRFGSSHNSFQESKYRAANIDSSQFKRLLMYLNKVHGVSFEEHDYRYTLDIKSKENRHRFTIEDLANISQFCKDPSADVGVTGLTKTKKNAFELREHYVRISSSDEVKMNATSASNELLSIAQSKTPKTYRLKKRRSVILTGYDDFQIDLTIVKQLDNKLSMTRFNTVTPKYEIEIEYIGNKALSTQIAGEKVKALLSICAEILKVIEDTEYLLAETKKLDVIKSYHQLVFKTDVNIEKLKWAPRALFAGPQPVSLEMKNLVETEALNILTDYTVTQKADGKRSLLYINDDGHCFLIDVGMNVRRIKNIQTDQAKNSLYDAEVIDMENADQKGSHDTEYKLVLVFDCYYFTKESVCNLKLDKHKNDQNTETRMSKVDVLIKSIKHSNDRKFKLEGKVFRVAKDKLELKKACVALLAEQNRHNLPYETDGLIFTPNSHPVGADNPSGKSVLGKTWLSTFKWKPPSQNTIDFFVKYDDTDIIKSDDQSRHKRLHLYVASKLMPNSALEFAQLVQSHQPKKVGFGLVPFNPPSHIAGIKTSICDVLVADDETYVLCDNKKDVIEDQSIVEMRWDDGKWVPLRVRHDKTDLWRASKNISGTANYIDVAMKVWRSIQNPVTEDYLRTLNVKVEAIQGADPENLFYAGDVERKDRYMNTMNEFHNKWIKSKTLIEKFKSRGTSVFEIACGRGGDMFKWSGIGITRLLGIDLAEDNIINHRNGAYARLLDNRDKANMSQYIFIPLSAASKIDETYINDISSESTKKLARIVWGYEQLSNTPHELKRIHNMVADQFDIVSCQFAIHFFFENDNTLDALCYNIDKNLKKGGYFIGTCFDGKRVHSELNGELSAKGLIDGKLVWMIEKGYEKYKSETGMQISVWTESINQTFTEYLVDYELLVERLGRYGIRTLTAGECNDLGVSSSSGTFDESFREMTEYLDQNRRQEGRNKKEDKLEKFEKMTPAETKFSFLNRWFIFRKDTGDVKQILKKVKQLKK